MNKQTKWYLSISILALILLVLIVVYKNSFKIALGNAGVGEQYIQYIDTGFDNNGNEYRVVFQYMSDNTVKIVHLTKDDFGVWHVTDEAHGPVSDAAYVMMGWMRTASMRRHEVNDPVVFDWEVHNVYGGNNAIKQMPEVELIMSNGQVYEHKGKINAISGTISESTGAVSLRAVFNNRNHLLRNGGSGTIIIPSELNDCIVIPQSATYELQDRIFVYRVIDGKASSTEILVSPQNNGVEYIVEKGLEVGDIIVAEGAGLIKEGATIKSRNEAQQKADTLKTEEGAL